MKSNIHVIPTNKRSKLAKVIDHVVEEFRFNSDFYNKIKFTETKQEYLPQHIYITSDEEIKEGDWFYNPKFNEIGINYNPDGCKKIVLTTDQDLINDDVQSIDDEFLKWFVKNPSCEKVEVKKGFADGTAWGYNFLDYKIIIPKEEVKPNTCDIIFEQASLIDIEESKQETLEETAEEWEKGWGGLSSSKQSFIEGAKWQAENSYTIEELKRLFDSYGDNPAAKIIWNDILNLKK